VTRQMVLDAQQAWGDGIVEIAAAHTAGADGHIQEAMDHINNLYSYGEDGPVLFKPTLAADVQFRGDFAGALSYFIGPDATTPLAEDDPGFAVKGWTAVRFESTEGIIISGTTAMDMGNYFFTKPNGDEVKVEYSFGYFLASDGTLRINLHHSSLPYVHGVTEAMVLAAQQAWGDGIVAISTAHNAGDNSHIQEAMDHINNLYSYGEDGPVLFKPTLAADMQFRGEFSEALSYFIGPDATTPVAEDSPGFAVKDWVTVRFENEGIITAGTNAMAMGNYFFTNDLDVETKVEYSFGYFLNSTGSLLINLHHSSLPYDPPSPAPAPAPA